MSTSATWTGHFKPMSHCATSLAFASGVGSVAERRSRAAERSTFVAGRSGDAKCFAGVVEKAWLEPSAGNSVHEAFVGWRCEMEFRCIRRITFSPPVYQSVLFKPS